MFYSTMFVYRNNYLIFEYNNIIEIITEFLIDYFIEIITEFLIVYIIEIISESFRWNVPFRFK